jgi:hypothetical protein
VSNEGKIYCLDLLNHLNEVKILNKEKTEQTNLEQIKFKYF